ncbi:MAG TPA: serine/threonine-protein kinase [Thermoanaerobaculia bacterium]|nr:serine/threonine-protein kinase [Thermoanaerobaculia bacterium]
MWLSDETVGRLQQIGTEPDLAGTKYRPVRELARGGMGTVWIAHDEELDREVALKVLRPELSTPEAAARMVREAKIVAALEHPGIIPVHDVGSLRDGRVFYAMKLVRGTTLEQFRESGPTRAEALRAFVRICEAVAFAHAHGVVHRDLKPGNVMVGPFGEVLVVDWGVAKLLRDAPQTISPSPPHDEHQTRDGTVVGTPGYMAPEQERGEISLVDERSDVFALGAILRFLLGEAPAPPPLASILGRAMHAQPESRYPGASTLADDVVRFLDGLPVSAHRESHLERLARWATRHRTLLSLIAAYLMARFLVFLWIDR